MKIVEPDLNEMLTHTHRRWINERTPAAEALFNRVLMAVFAKARRVVNLRQRQRRRDR